MIGLNIILGLSAAGGDDDVTFMRIPPPLPPVPPTTHTRGPASGSTSPRINPFLAGVSGLEGVNGSKYEPGGVMAVLAREKWRRCPLMI